MQNELRSYRNPLHTNPNYWRILAMEGKIRRQSEYIRSIQKIGWQPTTLIREEDREPKVKVRSARRIKPLRYIIREE